jgi:hypothetical protein
MTAELLKISIPTALTERRYSEHHYGTKRTR